MSIAQIVNTFNATTLISGEELKTLLNKMVEEKKTVRVVSRRGVDLVLVNPDDLMPKAVRVTGVSPVGEDAEFPAARLNFAVFGNFGFETESNDPFEILKEVEKFKNSICPVSKVQFTKGIELKISKDLVKVIKNTFVKHEQKARVLLNKNDCEIIQEKAKQKFNILDQGESFFITEETEEYHAVTIDGTFCRAMVVAIDEIADTAFDIGISLKTAMMSMVVTALKVKEDLEKVIKSIKK